MRGKRSPRGRTAAGTHTRRPRTEGPRTLARESPPLSHVAAAAAQHLPRANTAGHGRVAQSVRPMRGRQRRRRAARGWSVSRHRQQTVTRAARERLWYADPFIFKREMRRFFLKARENHAQRKLAVGRGAAGTPLTAGGAVDRGAADRGAADRGGRRGRPSGRFSRSAARSRRRIPHSGPWRSPREPKTRVHTQTCTWALRPLCSPLPTLGSDHGVLRRAAGEWTAVRPDRGTLFRAKRK